MELSCSNINLHYIEDIVEVLEKVREEVVVKVCVQLLVRRVDSQENI